jgi:hypothetical protein
MSDIVERLVGWVYTQRLQATAEEAREEIDSLRHEVMKLKMLLRYEKARIDLIEADYSEKLERVTSSASPASPECLPAPCPRCSGAPCRRPDTYSPPCRQEATPDSEP